MAYELFFDGFETYSSQLDLLKFGYTETIGTTGSTYPNTIGRRGGRALRFMYDSNLCKPITPSTHVVTGVAIKADVGPIAIQLRNGATVHAQLDIAPSVAATLYAGGATIGTSQNVFPYSTFMFIEIGIIVGNAGVGSYEVRVNGSSVGWFPAAVADTQNGATTTIDNVRLDQLGNQTHIVDDFYITYGDELKWLGDSRIDRLLLTANSTPQDWTPSSGNAWERLNAGDGYVESDVDEATSLFEVADLSYSPLAIHGVKVGGLIKKSDAGYREACLLAKSNTTVVEFTAVALSTDTLGFSNILKLDPATGLAWELSAIQAFQPGLRVKV